MPSERFRQISLHHVNVLHVPSADGLAQVVRCHRLLQGAQEADSQCLLPEQSHQTREADPRCLGDAVQERSYGWKTIRRLIKTRPQSRSSRRMREPHHQQQSHRLWRVLRTTRPLPTRRRVAREMAYLGVPEYLVYQG